MYSVHAAQFMGDHPWLGGTTYGAVDSPGGPSMATIVSLGGPTMVTKFAVDGPGDHRWHDSSLNHLVTCMFT